MRGSLESTSQLIHPAPYQKSCLKPTTRCCACISSNYGDALAAEYPEFDEKIMDIGSRDICPPKLPLKSAWLSAMSDAEKEVDELIREFSE